MKIEEHPERVTKIKPFYIDDRKTLRKIIQQLLLIFCILKKKKYILPKMQN